MSTDTLDMRLKHWARLTPGHVFLSTQTQMTFSEVDTQVEIQSQRLVANWRGGPILLAGMNDQSWVLNLLGALRSRVPVVLLPPGWTPHEEAQITELAGATLRVEGNVLREIKTETAHERMAEWETSGVVLAFATSGSTGRPRLALRSGPSLIAEGERYHTLWQMSPTDVVSAALPLSHAYAFGAALAAALVTGATLVLDDFISPRRLSRMLVEKVVTILPLVGPMARSLARLDAGQPIQSELRIAMVGGGVVTHEMSQLFEAKWGLPLSQNYGSSETGALLASFPPHSAIGTGFPMPGVECRLSDALDGTSQLWVRMAAPPLGYITEKGFEAARLSPDGWWGTGDLFRYDAGGLYTMMGRIGQQIRRGGRTIQPREIEAVLLIHPAVDEVIVQGCKDLDEQECIEAHVLLKPGAKASIPELRDHTLAYLAPYKCPMSWHIDKEFPRTWSNKPAIKSSGSGHEKNGLPLFTALLSHRLSTAIVTAEATGLLDELAKKSSTLEQLAENLGLNLEALRLFLKFLLAMGVVCEDAEGVRLAQKDSQWWKPAIALEARLQQTWLTPESMSDVLRLGLKNRPFDQPGFDDEFARLYRDAMCGGTQASVARQVTRLFKLGLKDGERCLEIGRGIGILSKLLGQQLAPPDTELIALAPAPALICEHEHQEIQAYTPVCAWLDIIPPPARFNLIFVMNAIHWLQPAEAKTVLARLLAGLSRNGQLLIVDMFLPAAVETGNPNVIPWIFLLDWMTHGGTNFLTVPEVEEQLAEAGAREVGHRSLANLPFEVIHASR